MPGALNALPTCTTLLIQRAFVALSHPEPDGLSRPNRLLTVDQRTLVLQACAASFGLAVAIALLPIWMRPATPGQLPGFLTARGLNAHAPMEFIAGVVLLPLLAAAALRSSLLVLASAETRDWARNAAAFSLLGALWSALEAQELTWVVVPTLLAFATAFLLRHHDARFTMRDAVLVPATMTTYLALMDTDPSMPVHRAFIASVLLILALRLIVSAIAVRAEPLVPALCFALSPLALVLQAHFNGRDQRHDGWPPLLLAALSPLILRLSLPNTVMVRRRIRRLTALAIFPIAIFSYNSATSLLAAEGQPRADLFEDSHNLTPASEMLRGELPYRDIIPSHGLVQDGLLDYVIMRTGSVTAGRVARIHGVINGLNSIGGYAVAAAATGSPELGLLSWFLGATFGTLVGTVRTLPALVGLALIVAGMRTRSTRYFGWAGVCVVAGALTSIEFGAYTAIVLIIALLRFGPSTERRAAIRAAVVGTFAAAAVAAVALAAFGILFDAVRTTVFEMGTLGPVYSLLPFTAPPVFHTWRYLPEVAAAMFDKQGFLIILWTTVLLAVAVYVTRRPRAQSATRRRRLTEALLMIAVWTLVSAISYAERQHLYFQFVSAPLVAGALYLLFRSASRLARALAAAGVVVALMIGEPSVHLAIVSILRHTRGPLSSDLVEVPQVARARGALYRSSDATVIRVANEYLSRVLRPAETFFDFTNRGGLYFLLDRDCPIRQVEVAFYESVESQREVIAVLERSPHVRFAMIPTSGDHASMVDGVPNSVRAPLVWSYLEAHFRPAFEAEGVAFWKRIE
jgi:hypothetical protein